MGNEGKLEAVRLVHKLRQQGLKCDCDHLEKSVKAQMKYANKISANFTGILGEDEVKNRSFKLKNMSDGSQFEVSLDKIEEIINIINNN
nr:His/Gly/Thr/Pro-type tRNA ligase C-terminal domain-containing protein [Clostridium sp. UBA6640]